MPRPDLDALTGLNLERQHVNLLLCQNPQTVADMQVLLTSPWAMIALPAIEASAEAKLDDSALHSARQPEAHDAPQEFEKSVAVTCRKP